MTAANHALVGSIIGLTIHQPALALPLAFASHFALDSLPHFGYPESGFAEALKHKSLYIIETFDLAALLLLFFSVRFSVWAVLAGFLAMSPDFEWLFRYFFFERRGRPTHSNLFTKFHQNIQWGERPWGIYIEIGFFIVGFSLLRKYFISQ